MKTVSAEKRRNEEIARAYSVRYTAVCALEAIDALKRRNRFRRTDADIKVARAGIVAYINDINTVINDLEGRMTFGVVT